MASWKLIDIAAAQETQRRYQHAQQLRRQAPGECVREASLG
ncbi:hypothetical protein [Streptomyces sp. NRRL S-646]|nr:hypothetical protein [Streptomyces sp. NRRL S-646]